MKTTIAAFLLTLLVGSIVHADDEEKDKKPQRIEISGLAPDLDGAEVVIAFKVANTYRISGRVPRGRAPTFGVKLVTKESDPPLSVRVSGELADAIDRFGYHPPRAGNTAIGLTIEARGRTKVYAAPRDSPEKGPSYQFRITDLEGFRIKSSPKQSDGITK